jgi:hypothetical protein
MNLMDCTLDNVAAFSSFAYNHVPFLDDHIELEGRELNLIEEQFCLSSFLFAACVHGQQKTFSSLYRRLSRALSRQLSREADKEHVEQDVEKKKKLITEETIATGNVRTGNVQLSSLLSCLKRVGKRFNPLKADTV